MSSWALQRALRDALIADADLTALLGGAAIYDDVPQATQFPYVSIGPVIVSDWSTATEAGLEHRLTLDVWSRAPGKREVLKLLDAMRGILDGAALGLSDTVLVNLRIEGYEARRDEDGLTYRGVLRLRAVTEPAS